MNFLAASYQDGRYQQYLNTNPLLAVCLVGKKLHAFEQCLIQADGARHQICLSMVDALQDIASKKAESLRNYTTGLLKSEWCYKHQYLNYGCIVISIDWGKLCRDGLNEEFIAFLNEIETTIRFSRAKVVVACMISDKAEDCDEELLFNLNRAVKHTLGEFFGGTVFIDNNGIDVHGVSELRKAVVTAALQHHVNEVKRLNEKRKILIVKPDTSAAIARTHFQIGWHYLVARCYMEAKKHLLKAYKMLKGLFPRFSSPEVRIAASFFLWHVLSVSSLCGDKLTSGSLLFYEIQSHVDWVEQAFLSSQYGPNCRGLARVLRNILVAEWCQILARKTQHIAPTDRSDLLLRAAHSLGDVQSLLPCAPVEKFDIPSPPYVGTECSMDAYAHVLLSTLNRSTLEARVCGLIEEASSTASPVYRQREKLFLELSARPIIDFKCMEEILAKAWEVCFVTNFFSAQVLGGGLSNIAEGDDILYSLLNGCVCPFAKATQAQFRQRLSKFVDRVVPVLHYPRRGFQAPFTALALFSQGFVKAPEGKVTLLLYFFTMSTEKVHMTNVRVSLVDQSLPDASDASLEWTIDSGCHVLAAPGPIKLETEVPTSLQGGVYFCNRLRATTSVCAFTAEVAWTWDRPPNTAASDQQQPVFLSGSPTLHVIKPVSFASVECVPRVEVVEGEEVVMGILLRAKENLLIKGILCFPSLPKLFGGKLFRRTHDGSDVVLMPSPATVSSTEEATYPLADLLPHSTVSLRFCGKCQGSGVYKVPVVFRHSTAAFTDMEIVKVVTVVIEPPFTAAYTYFGSTSWHTKAGKVHQPLTRSMYTQADLNLLVKPQNSHCLAPPAILAGERYENEVALYYTVADQSKCSAAPLVATVGEIVTCNVALTCAAQNGLIVLRSNLICGDEMGLLGFSCGEMPCVLSGAETVSAVAQLRAQKEGSFSLGFVRVFFSPRTAPSLCLVADFALPPLVVVQPGISIQCTYPPSALFGSWVPMKLLIINHKKDFFTGELAVDTSSDCFTISGHTARRIDLSPHDYLVEQLKLLPLKVGELPLPVIELREALKSTCVASTNVAQHITVLADCQPYASVNALNMFP